MANLRINLFFLFITGTMVESSIIGIPEELNLTCDISNSKYWDLIEWYFERTPYVIATSITDGPRANEDDISTVFLMHLTKLKLTVYLCRVDYYNEGDPVSFANTFDWRGQKYELRLTEKLMRYKRQIETGSKSVLNKNRRRLDEPELGAFVFAQTIDVFNNYLFGTPRRPFQTPRNYMILFVEHAEEGWKETGAIVLERLWKSYGIIHALLIAPCTKTGENVCKAAFVKGVRFYWNFSDHTFIEGSSSFMNAAQLLHYTNLDKMLMLIQSAINDRTRIIAFSVNAHVCQKFYIIKFLQVIGQYDPFYINDSSPNPLSSSYGRCDWTTIEDFTFKDKFLRKLATLNKFPLRVSLFPRYPTVLLPREIPGSFARSYFTRVSNTTRYYSGVDAIVLGNMAEAIDFKPDIRQPSVSDYGYKLSNGTFTGSLGDVLYRRVYASFNSRFISDYDTDDIDFLFPVYSDKVCVITPKALKVPQWMAIFKCFSQNLWLLIVLINTLCGYVWYLLKSCAHYVDKLAGNIKSSKNQTSRELGRFSVISIEMWIIMLGGVSIRLPNRSMERLFLSVCLVSNIIIAGSFQGSLFTAYSRTTFFKDIDTLEELDKSGLPIGTTSANLKDIFSGVGTAVLESLNSKFSLKTGVGVIVRTSTDRDICCIERQADINVILLRYELDDGTELLHPVKECPRSYYLSYIVKKGWPFKPVFDNVIQRYFEAGLLAKWHDVVEDSIIYKERLKRLRHGSYLRVFSLDDMQTAFYILGIGLFCCLLVFLCEYFYQSKNSCKHIKTACKCNLK